ncbi:hypothetical protein [Nocardiopsis nanhaiensis]
MTTTAIEPGMRRVLDRPRGSRFRPPGTVTAPPTESTPSPPPPTPSAARFASLGRTPRERAMLAQMRGNPRVEHRLRYGTLPEWMYRRPEPAPTPPRLEPRQPGKRGAHRKPRRVVGWQLASYALATSTGLIIGQFVGLT